MPGVTGLIKKNEDELGKGYEKLKEKGVNFELGSNYLDKLSNFDVAF